MVLGDDKDLLPDSESEKNGTDAQNSADETRDGDNFLDHVGEDLKDAFAGSDIKISQADDVSVSPFDAFSEPNEELPEVDGPELSEEEQNPQVSELVEEGQNTNEENPAVETLLENENEAPIAVGEKEILRKNSGEIADPLNKIDPNVISDIPNANPAAQTDVPAAQTGAVGSNPGSIPSNGKPIDTGIPAATVPEAGILGTGVGSRFSTQDASQDTIIIDNEQNDSNLGNFGQTDQSSPYVNGLDSNAPLITDSLMTAPQASDPMMTDPMMTNPDMSDPFMNDPAMTDPALSDPMMTNPDMNDPFMNDPFMNDPFMNDPAMTDPAMTDPMMTNPDMNDPFMNDPFMNDPFMNDPAMSDPMMGDPFMNDPFMNDSMMNDRAMTDSYVNSPYVDPNTLVYQDPNAFVYDGPNATVYIEFTTDPYYNDAPATDDLYYYAPATDDLYYYDPATDPYYYDATTDPYYDPYLDDPTFVDDDFVDPIDTTTDTTADPIVNGLLTEVTVDETYNGDEEANISLNPGSNNIFLTSGSSSEVYTVNGVGGADLFVAEFGNQDIRLDNGDDGVADIVYLGGKISADNDYTHSISNFRSGQDLIFISGQSGIFTYSFNFLGGLSMSPVEADSFASITANITTDGSQSYSYQVTPDMPVYGTNATLASLGEGFGVIDSSDVGLADQLLADYATASIKFIYDSNNGKLYYDDFQGDIETVSTLVESDSGGASSEDIHVMADFDWDAPADALILSASDIVLSGGIKYVFTNATRQDMSAPGFDNANVPIDQTNVVFGTSGIDTFVTDNGYTYFNGMGGGDTVTLGSRMDVVAISGPAYVAQNDVNDAINITDFSSGTDKILLDGEAFYGVDYISYYGDVTLDSDKFTLDLKGASASAFGMNILVINDEAQVADALTQQADDEYFIYTSYDGVLYFDTDISSPNADLDLMSSVDLVALVDLEANTDISSNDIYFVNTVDLDPPTGV